MFFCCYTANMEQMDEELSFDGDFQKEKIGPQKRFWILVLALALLTAGILVLVWLVPKQRTLPVFSEISEGVLYVSVAAGTGGAS